MPPETRFLIPVYRERHGFGDLTVEANRRRLATRITGPGSRFKRLGLRRQQVVEAIVSGPPTLGSALGIVWREFARSRGKPRWGEKRPGYWRDLDWVLRLFPDAQVVHMIRDPRACTASLARMSWWHGGLTGSVATWALADRRLRGHARRAAAGSYHAVRYEDLLGDPTAALEQLCGFLGEDFDERMLAFSTAALDIVPARSTWHSRTHGDLDPTRIDAWRSDLAPTELGLIERVLEAPMRAQGYLPSGTTRRPRTVVLARYHLDLARRYASLQSAHALDRAVQLRERQPVAADPLALRPDAAPDRD